MGRGGLLGSPFLPPKETHPSPFLQGVWHDLTCCGGCCLKLPCPDSKVQPDRDSWSWGPSASDATGGCGALLIFLVVLRRLVLGRPGLCLAPQQADGLQKPGVGCLGPQRGCCPPWPQGLLTAWGQLGSLVQVTVALRQRGWGVGRRGEIGGRGQCPPGQQGVESRTPGAALVHLLNLIVKCV